METQGYTVQFTVRALPQVVFDAVNRVSDWWSGHVEGSSAKVGDAFMYTVLGVHRSRQEVVEWVPGKKVVWLVTEAHLSFVNYPSEWEGTRIEFVLVPKGDETELRFTHHGLVPDFECHEACSNAWGLLVGGNLRNLILTGLPQPSPW